MEFDKSRVYTVLNADELPIGSKCVFADTVKALREEVETGDTVDVVRKFTGLYGCVEDYGDIQFSDGFYTYNYAYLIEPPAEPKYKPFESIEKAMEAIRKHGGWIKSKTTQGYFLIGALKSKKFTIIGHEYWEPFSFLLEHYVFADDGSPCGELVEE
ncbi:hypothetical protein GWP43_12820 [Treponema vincentii]|jgi:hypothetical protein|uniref:Uncharacterized protein n=1 Tax=Treponema vincentii TaxID=69710 RepID=A0A6P1Y0G0_9SPIR|nr:hypothetical protein [Treponema vincentii]QHX42859.1 hypothetical protein GWP43_04690 [Treponema vincentii]QHX44188.1 hypothetical protein GWP43_12820 [Treponema vincentii]DAX39414.1 MAG TPA: hypothetical protein [Caudoviricetes sp.]